MKVEGDTVTFSSGKTRYAHAGIIGLGDGVEVSEGYDGGLWCNYENEYRDDPLSKEDLQELADFMIERWQAWRATVSASPDISDKA
jgi:hypothetical protein